MRACLSKSFVILCFISLFGCGNIGELYLPEEKEELQETINPPSKN